MDVLDIALRVTDALERLGIGYFLGGSLASSFQGEPRATNDIDLRESRFDRSEFARRQRVEVRAGRFLFVKSPEDSVLRKLLWYRTGVEVSDRQWRDVVQILRQSRALLDRGYLDEWAGVLGVVDLLARATGEAGR